MADAGKSATLSTGAGGHGTTTHTNEASSTKRLDLPPPSLSNAVEMSDLDASKRTAGAGSAEGEGSQGGLLNDVSIPTSSPMDSSFPTSTTTNTAAMTSGENTRPGNT